MYMKSLGRIPFIAFFIFVMMGFMINIHTTYGQTPTPILSPIPIPTPSPATTGVVVGTVVSSADGSGIANATVSTDTGISTVTDPSGSYVLELSAGSYLLTASATGFISASQPVDVLAGAATTANFALQPETTGGTGVIFGFVYDSEENPMKGVTVTITDTDFSDSAETDDDGFYTFENLAAGDYTLTYEKDGYQTQTRNVSLLEGEVKEIEPIIMEETVKGKISGTVINKDGDPIENVRLKIKGINTKYKNSTSSDADGFFEFKDLEADTYVITATKKGYRKTNKTVKLEEEEEEEVEIVMKRSTKRIMKASEVN